MSGKFYAPENLFYTFKNFLRSTMFSHFNLASLAHNQCESLGAAVCVCICSKVKMLSTLGVYRNIFSHVLLPAKLRQLLLAKMKIEIVKEKVFRTHKIACSFNSQHSAFNLRHHSTTVLLPMYLRVKNSPRRRRSSLGLLFTSSSTIAFRFMVEFLVLLKFTEIEFTLLQSNFRAQQLIWLQEEK